MRSAFVLKVVLGASLAFLLSGRAHAQSITSVSTLKRDRLMVDGRRRTYFVHVPSCAATTPGRLPLVLALHGHGGTARGVMRISGLNAKAEAERFIIVYPEGASWLNTPWRSWNAGSCCGYALARRIDDVRFIRVLLDTLESRYPIDPDRIYVTGISNGAMMAYRLACELSDRIAAIAPIAGTLGTPTCDPARPVRVIAFHGTDDAYVPYLGGLGRARRDSRVDASVETSVGFWVSRNGCAPSPTLEAHGHIIRQRFGRCKADAAVELDTIDGGGHSWPGGRRAWLLGDRPTGELSATDAMWSFFTRQSTGDGAQ